MSEYYIAHSGAHYSKNWNKDDQKKYNHWYYINKIKAAGKSIKDDIDKATNDVTGAYDKKMEDKYDRATSVYTNRMYNAMARSNGKATRYWDQRANEADEKRKYYKEHRENNTLYGKIKKMPDTISEDIDNKIGKSKKQKLNRSKTRYENGKKFYGKNDYVTKRRKEQYESDQKAYNKTLMGRHELAKKYISKFLEETR